MPKSTAEGDVGKILDGILFSRYHVIIILILGLVGYLEAYATAMTGSLIVLAKSPLDLTNYETRWLILGPTATLCASMLISSSISDLVSRKTILQIGVIISTFFTITLLFVTSAKALIVMRLLGGIGFGMALPAAYPIGSEIMPAKHRRTYGAIYEILLAFGFSSVAFFGYLGVRSDLGWKMLAIPGGVLLFFLPVLIHFFVPESPRWLAARGKADLAIKEINKIARWCGSEIAPASIAALAVKPTGHRKPPGYGMLFAKSQIRKTFVSISTWICVLVAFYLFSTMLPKALIAQGDSVQVSLGLSGILFCSSIPGKLFNGFLMEAIGRRLTIMVTLLAAIIGLVLMATAHLIGGQSGGGAFVIGTMIVGFTVMSSFPVVRIYMTEQFSTELRGRGYFLSEGVGRGIAGILVPLFIIGHLASPVIFFGTMIAFTLAGAMIPILFGLETVGTLERVAPDLDFME